ncbi:GMC oxidoreductase [Phanerochaete sordida]|uniref:GMC oxidoreductase n=1 Tax=Phanerochaete sordida TaxID=48140 RepID=A0A9P3LJ55_9APHY|nr:GMC oxidoreductase [Phanerochaete sordida]
MPIVTSAELTSTPVDYVIVGGGTAGLALAARLSEEPDFVVAVLEAGAHHAPAPEIDVPGLLGRALGNPAYDWAFASTPQARAHGRVVPQPRGKGLGGTSLINYMGVFRPNAAEADALEELGCAGWNWGSLLHYMKKSETLQRSALSAPDAARFAADPDPAFHGTDGPVQHSFGASLGPLHAAFFDTLAALGVPRNPDTSSGNNAGSMTALLSVDARTATRSHAARAYLAPALARPNLRVLPGAHVTKVILEADGELQRALGVEFIADGATRRLDAAREVILAAGTYQTPQLLELSGVGAPGVLGAHGVALKVALPGVGENLQDHIGLPTVVEIVTDAETTDVLREPAVARAQEELYKSQQGLYAAVPAQAFAFLPARALGAPDDMARWAADARAACVEAVARAPGALRAGLERQYAVHARSAEGGVQPVAELLMYTGRAPMPSAPPPAPGTKHLSLVCALSRPFSRGSVHIASAAPLTPPSINPNYFAHGADLALLLRALKFALRVYDSEPIAGMVTRHVMPDRETVEGGDEALEEYARANCRQVFHPVGTAAMAPRAHGGVVDAALRVYGTSNLRVADLSVLPLELVCHTMSVAYAIGEKAADIIKAERGRGVVV